MQEILNNLITGIDIVDEQHKMLFVRLDELINLGCGNENIAALKSALEFLEKYAMMHFETEECLMRQACYPKFEAHKELHRTFIDKKNELKKLLVDDGYKNKLLIELRSFLVSWLINHIKNEDMVFGEFWKEQNEK
ncbi:MAG: bacteriohemerythrin [Defluviitaleaceae bacterium]|nr:bacteriohemerythrin [Defluviitaleaceae bacterium]